MKNKRVGILFDGEKNHEVVFSDNATESEEVILKDCSMCFEYKPLEKFEQFKNGGFKAACISCQPKKKPLKEYAKQVGVSKGDSEMLKDKVLKSGPEVPDVVVTTLSNQSVLDPDHYKNRKGEDLFEEWYNRYPFEIFRAILYCIAERYLRRYKEKNGIEDFEKGLQVLGRLKSYEVRELNDR